MNKKLICLVLAMVMLCAAPMAFANSPQSPDAKTTVKSSGGSGSGTLTDTLAVTLVPLSASAEAVLAAIGGFPNAIDYFDAAVQSAIAALLPAGFDLNSLVMNEFQSLAISGFQTGSGDYGVSFTFATAYPNGAILVALVGIESGSGVVWTPLKAEVFNGVVTVYFTQQVLAALSGRTAMLAILSGN